MSKAVAATERLQSDSLRMLHDAQMNYIKEKLALKPDLLVRVIAVIDGISLSNKGKKGFFQPIHQEIPADTKKMLFAHY